MARNVDGPTGVQIQRFQVFHGFTAVTGIQATESLLESTGVVLRGLSGCSYKKVI